MLIPSEWHTDRDGVICPVLWGEVEAGDNSYVRAAFLLDTGAARTVLAADLLLALGKASLPSPERLAGVGGRVDSVWVDTHVLLKQHTGRRVRLNGPFSAVTDPTALDMSVIGRDLLNQFAVIVDRPGDRVCLVCQNHTYRIEPPV